MYYIIKKAHFQNILIVFRIFVQNDCTNMSDLFALLNKKIEVNGTPNSTPKRHINENTII